MQLQINANITISDDELEFQAIRAQGAGGQNVNKVNSAIYLKFDINASSLPDAVKQRLLALSDQRLCNAGCLHIKAQEFRTQEKNRDAAISRLVDIIVKATIVPKKRRATKPTMASKVRRMDKKSQRGDIKRSRQKVDY